ncbi:hypothetical protein PVK06_033746 [Gossypium arboreum]|uniref:Spt6 acidic N-terminal domain-containing protein n=1 Tax=Gossypium arboreum TaxID=29729 RepID=A0ABR0NEG1_GOSAR|nr:hypothetical protein PVK06_033746 [Gossypium arboreum]
MDVIAKFPLQTILPCICSTIVRQFRRCCESENLDQFERDGFIVDDEEEEEDENDQVLKSKKTKKKMRER